MVTLTQLEYLIAVDHQRHFGKAAEQCHVSQPTLSQQLQKLEDVLGFIVFDRLKKPVVPTDEGRRFIEQAKVVLREHRRLIHHSRPEPGVVAGEFRLAVIPTVAAYLLPLFIERFARAHPQVELFVEELCTESILAELRADRIDGAIMATPLHEDGLKEHPLFYEPMALYMSAGHPLLAQPAVDIADVKREDVWQLQDGNCFRIQVANLCSLPQGSDIIRNVHFQSGSLDTLRNLVRHTQGCTILPALMLTYMTVEEQADHVRRFSSPVPTREVSFVYRRDHWRLEIIRALELAVGRALEGIVPLVRDDDMLVLELC